MSLTPDRHPGPLQEEGIILDQETYQGEPVVDPTVPGGITFHDGSFAIKDGTGVFNPRNSSGFDISNIIWDNAGSIVYENTEHAVTKEA